MVTEIYFEIENKCLLSCKHCSSSSLKDYKQQSYKLGEIKNFLDLLEDQLHVYLTGGEPLLNKDIFDIVRCLREHRPNVNIGIFTCGIISANNISRNISYEEALELREAGLNDCYVSVYHYDYKSHDLITNLDGSHKFTVLSIKNMLAAGIEVKVHLVINRLNIGSLDETIQFIAGLGVNEIRILRLVKTGNAIKNWDIIGVPYSIQNDVITQIVRNKSSCPVKLTISGFPELTPCRPFEDAVKCQGGTHLFYVTFEGDVYPCACTKKCEGFRICKVSELGKMLKYINDNDFQYNNQCLNPLT